MAIEKRPQSKPKLFGFVPCLLIIYIGDKIYSMTLLSFLLKPSMIMNYYLNAFLRKV